MTPERLEEIRRRVETLNRDNAKMHGTGMKFADRRSDDDRRELLTEVDRLRAELDGVRADREALDAENQRLRDVTRSLLDAHRAAARIALEGSP